MPHALVHDAAFEYAERNGFLDSALAAKVVAKSAGRGVEDRVAHVRARLEQRTLFGSGRLGEDLIEVHLGRARWLALQVGVHLGHAERADAVGQGVVLLGEERAVAPLDALDAVEHPQRAGAVVGLLVETGHQVEQLPHRTWLGQG